MNFSTDRDLLIAEPQLFQDVPLAGQERLRVADAVVTGTALTSASANFAAANVGAGDVALLAGVPVEILARPSATSLTVSRLRPRLSDAAIAPQPGTNLELVIRTFAPQAALVHEGLLRMLGIDPGGGSALGEAMIVSLSVMAHLETLGTLERIFLGVIALTGDNGELWKKALAYHRRFAAACRSAKVRMDLDGDGRADFTRELGSIQFTRA